MLDAVALVVFVAQLAEDVWPWKLARRRIHCRSTWPVRRYIQPLFDPGTFRICSIPTTAAIPYRPGFNFRGSRQQGDAARRAGRLVTGCGDSGKSRMRGGKKSTEVALAAEQFRGEVTDMRNIDILGIKLRLFQAHLAPNARKHGTDPGTFSRPVSGESPFDNRRVCILLCSFHVSSISSQSAPGSGFRIHHPADSMTGRGFLKLYHCAAESCVSCV